MNDHDDPLPYRDHKLCGYLCTVLTSPVPLLLPFLCPCHLITDGGVGQCQIGFKTDLNDVLLSPIADPHQNSAIFPPEKNDNVRKKKKKTVKKRKKEMVGRGFRMGNGSVSVVNQIHTLVMHKYVKVVARVLNVCENSSGEVRVVVIVNVYLPALVFSGGQLPKSGAVAGSLFRHLSCDWEKRSSMLVDGGAYCKGAYGDNNSVWNLSDCHVLGCKFNCGVPDSSKRRRFELHEIFKSLPSVENKEQYFSSRVKPADNEFRSGIGDVTDDILLNILSVLGPKELVRVAATCHHLRSLAASIMPCMKLELFPHQQAAVDWMIQRERNAQVLPHPLYTNLSTEDGFTFNLSIVSGEIITGEAPTVRDFRGGMFCDEPGLGKTVTVLSLILKTQGTAANPPDGVQVTWCPHKGEQRCGYYEVRGSNFTSNDTPLRKRVMSQSARRGQLSLDDVALMDDLSHSSTRRARLMGPGNGMESQSATFSDSAAHVVRLSRVKRNLLVAYEDTRASSNKRKRKRGSNAPIHVSKEQQHQRAQRLNLITGHYGVYNETWVQCDACRKWRKVIGTVADTTVAWFCSMNTDPEHQSCRDAEEAWDDNCSLTYMPGFHTKGTSVGKEQNVSFFISVLKEHCSMINSKTKKP